MKGINAGENYLFLWYLYTVYVYDIHAYQLLAKLQPKYRPVSVIDFQGKIYYMSGERLLIYDTFEKYDEYIVIGVFTSLADYQNFLKSDRGRWPSYPQRVRQLINRDNTLYFVFHQNYLNFYTDMVIEQDEIGRNYIFPKNHLHPPTRFAGNYLGQDGKLITVNSPSENAPYLLSFFNKEGKAIKELRVEKPCWNKDEFNKCGVSYLFEIDNQIYFCCNLYNTNNFSINKGLILRINEETKKIMQIELSFRNHFRSPATIEYHTNSNSAYYSIAVNNDLSVDVLKFEVLNYENK